MFLLKKQNFDKKISNSQFLKIEVEVDIGTLTLPMLNILSSLAQELKDF